MKKYASNLIDSSPVGVFFTDNTGDRSYVNDRWCEITGLKLEQANNKDWLGALHPDDRERCQKEWEHSIKNWSIYKSVHRYQNSKGTVWVISEAFPISSQDNPNRGYIGTLTDITEQKKHSQALEQAYIQLQSKAFDQVIQLTQAKNRLKAKERQHLLVSHALSESEAKWDFIVANTPDVIITIDREANVLFVNRELPYLSKEKILNSRLYDTIESSFLPEVKTALMKVFDTGLTASYNTRHQTGEGTTYWFASRAGPIITSDQIVGATIIVTDITEQMLTQAQTDLHHRELARLSNLNNMEEMASGLAHEINQPLAVISNYAQASIRRLQSGQLSLEDTIEIQKRIVGQTARAGEIIARMRSLFRREELQKQPACLRDMLFDVIAFMGFDIQTENNPIKLNLPTFIPPICIDKIQVEQVITNLVKNGMEAMIEHNKKPLIEIHVQQNKKSEVLIRIIDRGGGICEQIRDKIFEPFFSTKPQGMGMGLSICRSIIEAHGGQLCALNNEKGGACFQILLPVYKGGENA